MALTAEERLYVFTILGIPVVRPEDFYQDQSSKHTVNREALLWQSQFRYLDYPYEYSDDLMNAVDARIATLSAAEESRVQDIIGEFQKVEFQTVHVKTDKVTVNYDKQRSHLRGLLRIIFPINKTTGLAQDNPMLSIG